MYRLTDKISMNNLGGLLAENTFALFIVYIICYFSMWKGVQTSGKVINIYLYLFIFINNSYYYL